MNIVALIGRLVADPELKYTPSGLAVCTLRIAVDRMGKKDADGKRESDFFTVTAWKQSAEFASNYLSKGQKISVEGRLQQRTWVQQDGQKRSAVDVVANNIQGLEKSSQGQRETPTNEPGIPEYSGGDDMDYDPFSGE